MTSVPEDPSPSPSPSPSPWLVVIDMQTIFGDASSPWCAAGFDEIVPRIVELVEHFGQRVVFTRYLAPSAPSGSWIAYFQQWPFALRPHTDPLFDLVEPFAGLVHHLEDRESFGKWDASMSELIGSGGEIYVVGVATECCVLMTVLAAADDGTTVHVVVDACAGGTTDSHRAALEIMALCGPQVTLTSSEAVLLGTG